MAETMRSFKIDFRDFLKGNNSHEDYPDGGFKGSTRGLNLHNRRTYITTASTAGAVYEAPEDTNIIAWGESVIDDTLLAVSSDGTFFSVNTVSGVATEIDNDPVNFYNEGVTKVVYYQGYYYVTSDTDIARLPGDLSVAVFDYWTTTLGQAALTSSNYRGMTVFRDILYVSDINVVHQIDGVTVQLNVLDLPEGYTITCMFIYGVTFYIGTDRNGSITKVFTWDGGINVSSGGIYTWNTDYEVDGRVLYFLTFQGVLYAMIADFDSVEGQKLNYFDGTKFKAIRSISQTNNDSDGACVASGSMFLIDDLNGRTLTRYGQVIVSSGTRNVFYKSLLPPTIEDVTDLKFKSIFSAFGNVYAFANSTETPYPCILVFNNLENASQENIIDVNFNTREFTAQVKPRKIIAYFDQIDLDDDQTIDFYWTNDQGESFSIPVPDTVDIDGKKRVSIDINTAKATKEITIGITIHKGAQFKSIECFYQVVEVPVNT